MKKLQLLVMLVCLMLGVGVANASVTFDEIIPGVTPGYLDVNGTVFVKGIHFSADTINGGNGGIDKGVYFGDLSMLADGNKVLGGDSYATITLDFTVPISRLFFDFYLNATTSVTEGVAVSFLFSGNVVGTSGASAIYDAGSGIATGHFAYGLGPATTATQAIIYFDPVGGNATYGQLDNLNTVPEPSTYLLLCLSLGVVGYARRRMGRA